MEGDVSYFSWWYEVASSVVSSFATAYVSEGSKGDTYTAIGATLPLIERIAEGACRTKSLQ